MKRTTVTPLVDTQYEIEVAEPYRLDFTVSVLRRLSTNVVDILTADGAYVRALGGPHGPVIVRVTQRRSGALAVTFARREAVPGDRAWALGTVRRMLGVQRNLSRFDHASRAIPWLRSLAARMRGVKPPRYPTLWEACVNAIVFQQISLVAASTISRRLITALGVPNKWGGIVLYGFPTADRFQKASDGVLRAAGLSATKLAALRRAADAIRSGTLDEAVLESLPSPDAAALLRRIKGIGPWTATVILLRGLGRLDVFPMNDSSVVRNLAFVAGSRPADIDRILTRLGPQRGMLYYHLLLSRLDARGDLDRASSIRHSIASEKPRAGGRSRSGSCPGTAHLARRG